MRPSRRASVLLATIVTVLAGATTPDAAIAVRTGPASCASAHTGNSTSPTSNQTAGSRPIVLVHGWLGAPMTATAKRLDDQLHDRINPFLFDYGRWAAYWAANDHIAPCLATYVKLVSEAHRHTGGDG